MQPGAEAQGLLARLKAELEAVTDPLDGKPAIKHAYRADEVYHGAMRDTGPDIVVGYQRGWRGSNESALGRVTVSERRSITAPWPCIPGPGSPASAGWSAAAGRR